MGGTCTTVTRMLLTFTVVVATVLSSCFCSALESTCRQGHQCMLLASCPSLHSIFLKGSPEQRLRVVQLTCGFQGRNEKVCCPLTNTTDVSTDPSTIPTTELSRVSSQNPSTTIRTPEPSSVSPNDLSTIPAPGPSEAPPSFPSSVLTPEPSKIPPRDPLPIPTPVPSEDPSTIKTPEPSRNPSKDLSSDQSSVDELPTSSNESRLHLDCGHPAPPDKIYGGTAAYLGAFPWMALLGYTFPGSDPSFPPEWQCGGSLINSLYVLTAAHCTSRNVPLTTVRLGENQLNSSPDCNSVVCAPHVQDFSPEAVFRHPLYNSKQRGFLSDDVALIRLDRPALMSVFVQPVCLPAPGQQITDVVGNLDVTVSGWGEVKPNVRSEQLLEVALPLVPLSECKKIRFYWNKLLLDEGQTCLGGKGGKDSCSMDSGGPAVVPTGEHHVHYVQVGIVSYGTSPCALEGLPGVYTDVTYYRNWIEEHLRRED